MPIKLPEETRFKQKIRLNIESGCLEWTAHKNIWGYGTFHKDGKHMLAHRAAYLIYKGVIPDGMLVCHKCDNPSCVNHEHLFIGTVSDNAIDRESKNRGNQITGTRNPSCKLTADNIKQINKMILDGSALSMIGKEFDVSYSTIYRIKYKLLWKHAI